MHSIYSMKSIYSIQSMQSMHSMHAEVQGEWGGWRWCWRGRCGWWQESRTWAHILQTSIADPRSRHGRKVKIWEANVNSCFAKVLITIIKISGGRVVSLSLAGASMLKGSMMSRTPGLLPVSVSLSFNCIHFFPISAPDMSTSCSCKGGWSTELVKEVLNQSQISQQFQLYFSTSNFIFLVLNKDLFMGEACLLNMFVDHCL